MELLDISIMTAVAISIILGLGAIGKRLFRSATIFQYEQGIKFHNGKFKEILGPGKYLYFTPSTTVDIFDMRPAVLQLNGQEVLSLDNVGVKMSLAVKYQILDPQALISEYQNFQEYLYMSVQFKLREVISSMGMDEILANRQKINDQVKSLLVEDKSLIGLSIQSVDLKDIMLSADLKKAFAEVVKAKKEALSLLEKARGETATLRSLANTAKMLENNPELAKLRLIQTIESSQGNTFIIDILNDSIKKTSGK
ncbi:slipin family protein [Siminovitchia fortis]|uniref:Slipin family protein n=1 Tax=Siminovitchia fortis TaxID=254758 RepID=A0A443IKC3_9BACI|nr:slipin family protein [Siminovitchia fortis]RWR05286.1 slipin family protein [Siminovitchia fortis]WHY82432.1 slipin family protein [Siminovitchia fortis]